MQRALPQMRRRFIAAAWIAGATIPLLATVFLVGCCVLPFHHVVHRLMPVCAMAMNVVNGNHADHSAQTPAPAREKQEPVKRIATVMQSPFRLAASDGARPSLAPSASNGYRSFISLGAVRCDQDIGLHVLVDTFLI